MNIISNLKNKTKLAIATLIALAMFSFHYYLMSTLPGEKNLSCAPGANLTPTNIAISLLLSISTGILIAGLITLYQKQQKKFSLKTTSATGLAVATGTLTMFCTFCTIPVISLFGLSIGLSAFTFYSIYFQIFSITCIGAALYLLNKQLQDSCTICKK